MVRNKVCPSNKFNLLNNCTSWLTVLICITIFACSIILILLIYQKNNIKYTTDITNKLLKSHNPANTTNISNISNTDISNEYLEHNNNKLFTKSLSSSNEYDINVNIRDLTSSIPNYNKLSYNRYEADKNIERIINPLLPPERSYNNTYGIPINIPSRGPLQSFQQIGLLYKENIENSDIPAGNNNESNILPLFGRPTYNGSNRWNYYTNSDKFQAVKMPINIDGRKCTDSTGCNELSNGDIINIPSYNGKFKVEIYNFDNPQYIPFVY